jgi:chitinase
MKLEVQENSRFFSSAVATNASRETFSRNIRLAYDRYGVDGIDIDWEYPGHEGASGNKVDSSDSQNFLSFLWCLRKTLPSTARITAAAQTMPFTDSSGPIREFAAVLDWVLVMNYDVWSCKLFHVSKPSFQMADVPCIASANPGPNAPMHDACKNSTQPEGNMVAAYDAWTNAGFRPSQLVLGVPSYGYVSQSNVTSLRTRSSTSSTVTVFPDSGQIQFRDLVSQGALVCTTTANPDGPRSCVAGGGFEEFWDGCSSTPFLRSPSAGQVVTYDDPKSLEMKAQLARELRILGTNMFDVHGDTDQWDLTKSVRKGLGCS